MFHGGGISPYGVDMFPGGVPGGAALPSPSAYSNPAATQFGVSLKNIFENLRNFFFLDDRVSRIWHADKSCPISVL